LSEEFYHTGEKFRNISSSNGKIAAENGKIYTQCYGIRSSISRSMSYLVDCSKYAQAKQGEGGGGVKKPEVQPSREAPKPYLPGLEPHPQWRMVIDSLTKFYGLTPEEAQQEFDAYKDRLRASNKTVIGRGIESR
jgi:hypothetical protein